MNKKILHSIISAGFVRGQCNRAVLFYDSRDLHCDFISDDQTMFGKCIAKKFNDGNNFLKGNFAGLPNVDSFLKMLVTLGDDIEATVEKSGRDDRHLILYDGTLQMKYSLIAKSQMPKCVNLKNDSGITSPTIKVNKDFINKFYKLSGAIKDCKYLFVRTIDNKLELVLSQSEDYSSGAKMLMNIEEGSDEINPMKFDVVKFRMMLFNNRGMDGGKIQFNKSLLAISEFHSENFDTKYFNIAE